MSQCARVLAVLADGRPHTVTEIHQIAGTMRLNSRVAELRGRGHNIVCTRRGGDYIYQMLGAAPEAPAPVPVAAPVVRVTRPMAVTCDPVQLALEVFAA